MKSYPIYKGLQKPLSYKGLHGKFIGWGAASLVLGLLLGGLSGALINIYLGSVVTVVSIVALFVFIFYRQRQGLHKRQRDRGIFIQPSRLKLNYENRKKDI
ncbi:plasmid transfer protein [Pedobacter sp. Leaf216]|uniref:hypothetical protein n=1 Tax=Pedobacter sp. Leaf216 TaxID=1735684 RepID=UPI0006F84667|nr:hypothetical protein [Pedobacter sp. Leaf216]KQM69217.1 plasmid transfer protein [Pedobacter sp. Leaf216]